MDLIKLKEELAKGTKASEEEVNKSSTKLKDALKFDKL